MSKNLQETADRILSGLDIRVFPDGYLEDSADMPQFDLPTGDEVMMYRELEGVFVMFGYERIFFKDPYEAKYVYYCAKKGMARIRMPDTRTLKKVIRDFQNDLESLRAQIEKEADRLGLNVEEKSEVVGLCAKKLGYYDIMDI